MSGSLNKVFLIGRLGGNPEVRSTSTGQDVANFSIATDESYIANNGDKIQKKQNGIKLLHGVDKQSL